MTNTVSIKNYINNDPTKYLIIGGKLSGSLTKFYPDAVDKMTDGKTWNFKKKPVIPKLLLISAYIVISKFNNDSTSNYYNIQIYEKTGSNWFVEIGIGFLHEGTLSFTLSNSLNGKIVTEDCYYFIERFIYATQNVYAGKEKKKVDSFVDNGKFTKTSKKDFEKTTGFELR